MALHDLWERTIRLQSEVTGISVEHAASVQGLFSYHLTVLDVYRPSVYQARESSKMPTTRRYL